ncbi:MAG: hypothetical protein ACI9U2_001799, partial [Bradymonadia bacterium]
MNKSVLPRLIFIVTTAGLLAWGCDDAETENPGTVELPDSAPAALETYAQIVHAS